MDADKKRSWVLRVLGVDVGLARSGPSREELTEQLKIIDADAHVAGVREEIARELRAAALAVQKDAPEAGELVERMAERLAALVRRQRMNDVRKIADGVVAEAGARLANNAACRLKLMALTTRYIQAVGNLEAACEALIATKKFVADPRIADSATQDAVADIGDRVPDIAPLVATVEGALDAMAAIDDRALQAPFVDRALAVIAEYQAEIDGDRLLTYMEKTGAGSFVIHSGLSAALADLAAALRG
jgi:hypothetical protein